MKAELVVFLDFDGVFHHCPPLKEKTDEENSVFYFTPNIEKACKELNDKYDVKIVFSTTWKEKFSFEDLKDFFEDYPSIYNSCYDSTPNLKVTAKQGSKWREANEWMKSNNYNGEIIILDDIPNLWLNEENKLPNGFIHCENQFSEKEIGKIKKFLKLENKPKLK